MREQECEYEPPSRTWRAEDGTQQQKLGDAEGSLDVAILMVDDRRPLPYRIPGTPFASPTSWGLPRTVLHRSYLPPRWGPMSMERANAEALAAMEAAVRHTTSTGATSPIGGNSGGSGSEENDSGNQGLDEFGGDGDDAGGGGESDISGDESVEGGSSVGGGEGDGAGGDGGGGNVDESLHSRVSSFQLAVVINHIFAQLHGHAFYLESPCVNTSIGVDQQLWERSISSGLKRSRRGVWTAKHIKYLKNARICSPLSSAHRLGPFPPRPPAWAKLAAIRHVARRHAFVLYLDSDAFVTQIWQPIEPLISLLGLRSGAKWLAVAGEYPPQKLRRDTRAGLANSGVILLAGVPTAGAAILSMLEDWIWPSRGLPIATFSWPYEQNALTQMILLGRKYSARVALLRPGCPLNSPFGAYVRHMVGGTPDRSVYHHHHRAAWLLQALRCTVNLVTAAASAGTERAGLQEGEMSDGGALMGAEGHALQRAEGCAPNEPRLLLSLGASCGASHNFSSPLSGIEHGQRPVGGAVLSRVSASWWRACCAFCVLHEPCKAWSFHEGWPADTLNCLLLDGFRSTTPASKTTLLGRIPLKPYDSTRIMSAETKAEGFKDIAAEVLVTYAVPAVAPWDAE